MGFSFLPRSSRSRRWHRQARPVDVPHGRHAARGARELRGPHRLDHGHQPLQRTATQVDLVPVNLTVDEGSPIEFNIVRSGDPYSSFTVNFELKPIAGSTFSGADLAPTTAITGEAFLGISEGPQTPNSVSISIATFDDLLEEGIEGFTVEITGIAENSVIGLFSAVSGNTVIAGTAKLSGQINASHVVVTPPDPVNLAPSVALTNTLPACPRTATYRPRSRSLILPSMTMTLAAKRWA